MQYLCFTAGIVNYHKIAIPRNPYIYGCFFPVLGQHLIIFGFSSALLVVEKLRSFYQLAA